MNEVKKGDRGGETPYFSSSRPCSNKKSARHTEIKPSPTRKWSPV